MGAVRGHRKLLDLENGVYLARADRAEAFREKYQYHVAATSSPEDFVMRAKEHDLRVWPHHVKFDVAADFQRVTDNIRPKVTIADSAQDTSEKYRQDGFEAMLSRGYHVMFRVLCDDHLHQDKAQLLIRKWNLTRHTNWLVSHPALGEALGHDQDIGQVMRNIGDLAQELGGDGFAK